MREYPRLTSFFHPHLISAYPRRRAVLPDRPLTALGDLRRRKANLENVKGRIHFEELPEPKKG